jgi:outer membrane protein
MRYKILAMASVTACGLAATALPCLAQTGPATETPGNWLVHADAAGIFKDASAEVFIGGARVPGGTISSPSDATVTFDAAYFLTPNFAIDLYAGIPPRAVIRGAGTLSDTGTLATTNYGPAVLSGEYHFTGLGGFHPYVAAGLNYTLFLNIHHEALYDVKIPNAFGAALKLGVDYDLSPAWSAHFYVMHIFLGTRVSAFAVPDGSVPAVAKATIDPTIIGAGMGYRF